MEESTNHSHALPSANAAEDSGQHASSFALHLRYMLVMRRTTTWDRRNQGSTGRLEHEAYLVGFNVSGCGEGVRSNTMMLRMYRQTARDNAGGGLSKNGSQIGSLVANHSRWARSGSVAPGEVETSESYQRSPLRQLKQLYRYTINLGSTS